MAETEDLSQVFGDSGAASFGDLPKVAETDTPPSRARTGGSEDDEVTAEVSPTEDAAEDFGVEDADALNSEIDDAFSVPSYVVPAVARNIAALRKKTGKTNAVLVMDAIDSCVHRGQMGKLISRRQTGAGRPKGSLFPSRRTRGRSAPDGKNRKLWTFQATPEESAVMDELVERFGANSLSELVSVAVEARYTPKART